MLEDTITKDDLIALCEREGVTHRYEGDRLIIESRDLLHLSCLESLPEGVTLSAGGALYLCYLTTLPKGVTLRAGEWLSLNSLESLPEGVTLNARGSLYLRNLTTLPEGVTLSAGGLLFLDNLTGAQTLNGRRVVLGHADGLSHRELTKPRAVGDDTTVQRVALLRGSDWDKQPVLYLARQGDLSAHGETLEQALHDLRFKALRRDFDLEAWAAEAVKRDRITREDYHLATGACETGIEDWLGGKGFDPSTEAVTVQEAIDLCRGGYGSEEFIEALEDAQREAAHA